MRVALPVCLLALVLGVVWYVSAVEVPGGAQVSQFLGLGEASADGQANQTRRSTAAAEPMAEAKRLGAESATSAEALSEDRRLAADGQRMSPAEDTGALSDEGLRAREAHGTAARRNAPGAALLGCLIEPDRVAEVGSPVLGVVESIQVERGDRVKEGQVLARLRAEVERASVGVAHARARAEADVRAALTNAQFLRQKQTRAEELVDKNFISQQALEQARAETRVAEEKLAQAREQQAIWQRELELAHAQLRLRAIRAPFDGVVAERYVTVGERIEEKPMFRLVKADPLRIEMVAPAALFGTVSVGALAQVTPELRNAPTLPAEIVLVDSLVDGASNTFRLRAQLANEDGALPSGLRCRAEFKPQALPAAAPPAPGPQPQPVKKLQVDLKFDTRLSALQSHDGAARLAKP